jgi:hypothetical protein
VEQGQQDLKVFRVDKELLVEQEVLDQLDQQVLKVSKV